MAILMLLTLIMLLGAYWFVGKYRDEDGRLPAASTPEGRQIRIILVPLLALCATTFILTLTSSDKMHVSKSFIVVMLIIVAIPVYRYFEFKDKQK